MKEIDQKLDHWIHNSIIREEIRDVIVNHVLNKIAEAYKAGYVKGAQMENEIINSK